MGTGVFRSSWQFTLVKRQAGALCNPLKSSATVTVPAATSK